MSYPWSKEFVGWAHSLAGKPIVAELRALVMADMKTAATDALRPGDTEYAKGRYDAFEYMLRNLTDRLDPSGDTEA